MIVLGSGGKIADPGVGSVVVGLVSDRVHIGVTVLVDLVIECLGTHQYAEVTIIELEIGQHRHPAGNKPGIEVVVAVIHVLRDHGIRIAQKREFLGKSPRRIRPTQQAVLRILDAPLRAIGKRGIEIHRQTRIPLECHCLPRPRAVQQRGARQNPAHQSVFHSVPHNIGHSCRRCFYAGTCVFSGLIR